MEKTGPAVAVIAGTPYDAGLGRDLLREAGVPAGPHAMASSPDEQDHLQYERPDELRAAFHRCVCELRERGTELVMLFCNSLAAVVDHERAALPVLSPATVYREVAEQARSSFVVTGNANALVGAERTLRRTDPRHRLLGVSDPTLVRGIEAGDPEAAFHASQLPVTLPLAERLGLSAVVLACTHFTALLPLVRAASGLPIVDVGGRLVELTVKEAASHG
jgi:glutamate racemase